MDIDVIESKAALYSMPRDSGDGTPTQNRNLVNAKGPCDLTERQPKKNTRSQIKASPVENRNTSRTQGKSKQIVNFHSRTIGQLQYRNRNRNRNLEIST